MKRAKFGAIAPFIALFAGCIVSDDVTTLTIHPDGSADLIAFSSNTRSTELGSKADEELRRYAEEFDARKNDEFDRIARAGGKVLDTWWGRRELPYSRIISARLPTADALEKFTTIEGDQGELRVVTRYSQERAKRRLSFSVLPPKDLDLGEFATPSIKDARQRQANGLSEIRLVMLRGDITGTRGWTVASDKQSALLALDEIADLLRTNPDGADLFIEWEVKP